MTDLSTRFASRLAKIENHLAYVVSLHLFAEHLLDRLLEKRLGIPRDKFEARAYTFYVKISLADGTNLLPDPLLANMRALNGLRNAFAHRLDVDLSNRLTSEGHEPFLNRHGERMFDAERLRSNLDANPEYGLEVLQEIGKLIFEWLKEIGLTIGADLS